MSGPSTGPAQPPALSDVSDRADVERLLRAFYRRAFADELLGPVFAASGMDLEQHLPIMCDFWETVLFRAGLYRRNALAVHKELHERVPLRSEHFDRWLELWTTTVSELFQGAQADLATVQAERIAWSINRRLSGSSGSELHTVTRRDLPLTRSRAAAVTHLEQP
ncbi:MAG: hypothetical protein JWL64_978 [Frankiales bacterium]|nr:hypothetical protein [Frankiales bacterium]